MTSAGKSLNRRELIKRSMAVAITAGIPTPLLAEALALLDVACAGSIRPILEDPLKTSAAQALKLDLHIHAKGADAVAHSIVDGSLRTDINLSGQNVPAEHPNVSLTLSDKTYYPEPLVYYAAVLKGAANSQGAIAFTKWLQGREAQVIFSRYKYGSPRSAPTLHA